LIDLTKAKILDVYRCAVQAQFNSRKDVRGVVLKVDATLYELLGISKERANEIAKKVREAFSESESPAEWVMKLIDEFNISQEEADIFACAWFAGRYAGVSEVFRVVQWEMDRLEQKEKDKVWKDKKYPPSDGYA
jgi:hypothetical protein